LIIFLLIALLVYISVNGYILWRGASGPVWAGSGPADFQPAFLGSVLAFPAGRLLNSWYHTPLTEGLVWLGSYHLALMLYLFLLVFVKDVIRWLGKLAGWSVSESGWLSVRHPVSFLAIVALTLLVVVIGHFNAINTRVKVLE